MRGAYIATTAPYLTIWYLQYFPLIQRNRHIYISVHTMQTMLHITFPVSYVIITLCVLLYINIHCVLKQMLHHFWLTNVHCTHIAFITYTMNISCTFVHIPTISHNSHGGKDYIVFNYPSIEHEQSHHDKLVHTFCARAVVDFVANTSE